MQVLDQWVEEHPPVVGVVDRPGADVHERQRTEEQTHMDQRIRHGQCPTQHRRGADKGVGPFVEQLWSQDDHAENEVHRGADECHHHNLHHLRGGEQEDHVEALCPFERYTGRRGGHRCEGVSARRSLPSGSDAVDLSSGLTRSTVLETTKAPAMASRNAMPARAFSR